MSKKHLLCAIFVALLLLLPTSGRGSERGRLPITLWSEWFEYDPGMFKTAYVGDGYTVTWEDRHCALLTKKFALSGTPLWNGEKKSIFTELLPQPSSCFNGRFSLISDGAGGSFIAQAYNKGTDTADYRLRVQRFSGEAVLWGEEGKDLSIERATTVEMAMSGGALIVAWHDNNGITLRRFDQDGNLDPLWNPKISSLSGRCLYPTLSEDGEGGVIVTYVENFNGTRRKIQRIGSDGSFKWGPYGIRIGPSSTNFHASFIHKSGDEIVVTWPGDKYITIGSITVVDGPYIFAQKIDNLATGHQAWDSGGVLVSSEEANTADPVMVPDGNKGAWIVWGEHDAEFLTTSINARYASFDDGVQSTVKISEHSRNHYGNLSVVSDLEGGAVVTWLRWGNASDIPNSYFGQRFDSSGALRWIPADGVQLTEGSGASNGYNPQQLISGRDKDGLFFAWYDEYTFRDSPYGPIYGQRIDADGNDISAVLSTGEKPDLPKESKLFPNYPNPFNPSTAIRYTLSSKTDVTLKVYNVAGREIVTLVNGKTQQPGTYEVQFRTSGLLLSSGVYWYALQTKDGIQTGTMILQK